MLFAPCQRRNHLLFEILNVDVNQQDQQQSNLSDQQLQQQTHTQNQQQQNFTIFKPQKLKNLRLVDQLQNLACITDLKLDDLADEGNQQIYVACAAGQRSTLRILRHGLQLTNQEAWTFQNKKPIRMFSLEFCNTQQEYQGYLIISLRMNDESIFQSEGETIVLEHKNNELVMVDNLSCGIITNQETIHIAFLKDKSLIQILPNAIVHISNLNIKNSLENTQQQKHYKLDQKVLTACSNGDTIVLGLIGGLVVIYKLTLTTNNDNINPNITEQQEYFENCKLVEIHSKKFGSDVLCMDISPAPTTLQVQQYQQKIQLQQQQQMINEAQQQQQNLQQQSNITPSSLATLCEVVAVGFSDRSVRIFQIGAKGAGNTYQLNELDLLDIPSVSESVMFLQSPSIEDGNWYLFVGLKQGDLIRVKVSPEKGEITDIRNKKLSTVQVKCVRCFYGGAPAMLVLSSRAWLYYQSGNNKISDIPLSYRKIDIACQFNHQGGDQNKQNQFMCTSGNCLSTINLQDISNQILNQQEIHLSFSPRKMVVDKKSNNLIIIETDQHSCGKQENQIRRNWLYSQNNISSSSQLQQQQQQEQLVQPQSQNNIDNIQNIEPPEEWQIGSFTTTQDGCWISSIEIYSPIEKKIVVSQELDQNEKAVCLTMANSIISDDEILNQLQHQQNNTNQDDEEQEQDANQNQISNQFGSNNKKEINNTNRLDMEQQEELKQQDKQQQKPFVFNINKKDKISYFVIGTVKDLQVNTCWKFSGGKITVYQYNHDQQNPNQLSIIAKRELEQMPQAILEWRGKILCGAGNSLMLFQLSKKKNLLMKAQAKSLSAAVNGIEVWNDKNQWIFVSFVSNSVQVFKYIETEKTFYDISDDALPRWTSCFKVLDQNTFIAGDKYENIFVCRVPASAEYVNTYDIVQQTMKFEQGFLTQIPFKMEQFCHFYLGDIATCIYKGFMLTQENQLTLIGTSTGSLITLHQFSEESEQKEIELFLQLELLLKNSNQLQIMGLPHQLYRSMYSPCKGVIDGDLCQLYDHINIEEKDEIANIFMNTSSFDIIKYIEELKNKIF